MTDETKTLDPKKALQQRIREARAKSSPVEEQIAADEELRELTKTAKFEENKARDLPEIKKAEEKYGEIRWHNTPLGAIVVRKPNYLVFNRFMRSATSDKGMNEVDIWRMVKPCICHPTPSRVQEIIEEWPGVASSLGTLVVELGNGVSKDIEGK